MDEYQETLFSDTHWGACIVRMLSKYGLPEDVWVEDPTANPWRVFISHPQSSEKTAIRMMFCQSRMHPPLIEVEQTSDSSVLETVEKFVEDLDCCYSPAMSPPNIVLDLYVHIKEASNPADCNTKP